MRCDVWEIHRESCKHMSLCYRGLFDTSTRCQQHSADTSSNLSSQHHYKPMITPVHLSI